MAAQPPFVLPPNETASSRTPAFFPAGGGICPDRRKESNWDLAWDGRNVVLLHARFLDFGSGLSFIACPERMSKANESNGPAKRLNFGMTQLREKEPVHRTRGGSPSVGCRPKQEPCGSDILVRQEATRLESDVVYRASLISHPSIRRR